MWAFLFIKVCFLNRKHEVKDKKTKPKNTFSTFFGYLISSQQKCTTSKALPHSDKKLIYVYSSKLIKISL